MFALKKKIPTEIETYFEEWKDWINLDILVLTIPLSSPEVGNGNPSSILVWKIPQTEEHGGLQSTGSQRIGHN